jgi:hypothetical protein
MAIYRIIIYDEDPDFEPIRFRTNTNPEWYSDTIFERVGEDSFLLRRDAPDLPSVLFHLASNRLPQRAEEIIAENKEQWSSYCAWINVQESMGK